MATYYMSGVSLVLQYLTNLGLLAAGGQLNTYAAGTVNTPVTTYTDSTGISANANPLTLSGAARPATPSGAPVAFWVPGGTAVKLVVYDAGGNLLVSLDNIPAINDLTSSTTSLQALLASGLSSNSSGVGPVAGVDLVASAVKSYDVFSDVRQANEPTLVTGQTLNIEVQGALAVNDGLGGFFYWAPTASNTDDGRTVLKPNSVAAGSGGRWLRYYPLGVPLIVVKTVGQSVTNSTALVNDTQLTATLTPGVYLVQLRLLLQGAAATGQGYKVQPTFAGGVSNAQVGGGANSANGVAAALIATINSPVTAAAISMTGDFFNCDFMLTVSGSPAFNVQFAQNAATANATTVLPGSTLIVTRVG
jgi:hypothetical protein